MTYKLPPLPDLGPEWTAYWTKVVHEKMQAYAIAAIEAQGVPDGWRILTTERDEIIVQAPNADPGGLTIPPGPGGSLATRILEALCRSLLASAPPAPQAEDNWRKYATEREDTAQAVIERHREEIKSLLNLLAKDRQTIADLRAAVVQQEPVAWARYPRFTGSVQRQEVVFKQPEGSGWTPLYTHPDRQAKQPLTDEQKEVIAFLCGEAPLDGVWFGENHYARHGKYWWRHHLVNAFGSSDGIKGE